LQKFSAFSNQKFFYVYEVEPVIINVKARTIHKAIEEDAVVITAGVGVDSGLPEE